MTIVYVTIISIYYWYNDIMLMWFISFFGTASPTKVISLCSAGVIIVSLNRILGTVG